MVKFGRKFFFDKVHTKRNYTIPIIIGTVLLIIVITTFLTTRYFKSTQKPDNEIKLVLKDRLEIELHKELPKTSAYVKEIKNLNYSDLEVIYPENLKTIDNKENCDNEDDKTCTKTLVDSLGIFEVIIKSSKLEKEYKLELKIVDKAKPVLVLKEYKVTEGKTYKIDNFVESCSDNSGDACILEYVDTDKDENNEIIDYSKIKDVGTHTIKIVAKDSSGNKIIKETKLTINKKQAISCQYGNLKYSDTYVIATRIENTTCAISVKEAESITNKAALQHNKKLVKEIQEAYLQTTIDKMNLEGQITYEISYGLVYNSTKKGVVGYYLMGEAKQTVGNTTTTIARYYINEQGNRVWKVNTLNLK